MPLINRQNMRPAPATARVGPGARATRRVPTPAPTPQPEAPSPWDLADSIRMLLYGVSGSGKTTLWSTFPAPIRCMLCSGGNRPGELKSINTPENQARIDPVIITSTRQLEILLDELQDGNYQTVVLDHCSGLSDLVIMELLGLSEIPVSKYRKAGKGESWSLVSQQQYGQLATQLKGYFRTMLNLPCHVVLVAQERTHGGNEDGFDPGVIRPSVGAALTPSVVSWLNPACDYVLQMFRRPKMIYRVRKMAGKERTVAERGEGVEWCLRTAPHDTFHSKFRAPRGHQIPDVIVDPNYDKIQAVIDGRYNTATGEIVE